MSGADNYLIEQAKADNKQAIIQLALACYNSQDFEQADYWLNKAVSLRITELYPLRIQLWFSDQVGPWDWGAMEKILIDDVARHPEAYWLLAKARYQIGGNFLEAMKSGAELGSLQCVAGLATYYVCEGDVSGAKLLFEDGVKGRHKFSEWALNTINKSKPNELESTPAVTLDSCIGLQQIDNFLHPIECEWLRMIASPHCRAATIIDPNTGLSKQDPYRLSDTVTLIPPLMDPISGQIEKRVANALQSSVNKFEYFSFVRYRPSQQYKPHFDAFSERQMKVQEAFGGQRVETAIIYLNQNFEGGNTYFPKLNKSVNPKVGRLVRFSNVDQSGNIIAASLHEGEPVLDGEKAIVTKWRRENLVKI